MAAAKDLEITITIPKEAITDLNKQAIMAVIGYKDEITNPDPNTYAVRPTIPNPVTLEDSLKGHILNQFIAEVNRYAKHLQDNPVPFTAT